MLGGQKQDELVTQLQQRRLVIEAEIASTSQSIENLVAAIASSAALALAKRVTELEAKVAGLEGERHEVMEALNEIEQSRAVMSMDEISVLLDKVTRNDSAEFDDGPRRLLASEIHRVIRKIEMFSGDPAQPWDAKDEPESSRIEAMTAFERLMLNSYYIIHYVSGESEHIRPMEASSIQYSTNTRQRLAGRRSESL